MPVVMFMFMWMNVFMSHMEDDERAHEREGCTLPAEPQTRTYIGTDDCDACTSDGRRGALPRGLQYSCKEPGLGVHGKPRLGREYLPSHKTHDCLPRHSSYSW